MIASQRKRHLVIWLLMAVILPVLVFFAWIEIPAWPINSRLPDQSRELHGEIYFGTQSKEMSLDLRISDSGERQVELNLLEPLKTPFAMLYVQTEDSSGNKKIKALGNVGGKGIVRFPVEGKAVGFLIRDELKDSLLFEFPMFRIPKAN
jgi:hypothetical protein